MCPPLQRAAGVFEAKFLGVKTMATATNNTPYRADHAEVDDNRFPPGHLHRAGGVRVSAMVYLRDHGPSAEDETVTTLAGGEPRQSDVQFALSLIEQWAQEDAGRLQ